MKALSKVWIVTEGGKILFGEGRLRMLELVEELGSMNKAAAEMGMSFRTMWGKIHATEREMGITLIDTAIGGGRKGGSKLTAEARSLMKKFKALNAQVMKEADSAFGRIFEKA
jgi:molybdate transport system regulatory protein